MQSLDSGLGRLAVHLDLIGQQREVPKIRECLIVQIARDATSLTLRFVGEIETRACEFTISSDECGAGGDDSSSFENGPEQCQQRKRQKNCESG